MFGRMIGRLSPLRVQTVAFFLILILGTIGMELSREESDIVDSLYRSLQLFALEMSLEPGQGIHPLLTFIRFLAAAFSILAIVTLLSSHFAIWIRNLLQAFDGDRVIFFGYGAVNRALVSHLAAQRAVPITIVDQSFTIADRREARAIGALLIDADVTSATVHGKLCLGRASRIYIASGSDALNLEVGIAVAAVVDAAHSAHPGRTVRQTRRRYGCPQGRNEIVMVHAASPNLMSVLARAKDVDFVVAQGLSFFSFKTATAATLIARARFQERAQDLGQRRPHLVIAGAGEIAQAVFEQVLIAAGSMYGSPTVTIIDRDAAVARARFAAHYPRLFDGSLPEGTCPEPRFIEADIETLQFDANDTLDQLDSLGEPPSAWIFTCREDEINIDAALRLQDAMHALSRRPVSIFARAWEGELAATGRGLGLIQLFGQGHDSDVCERIMGCGLDWMAMAIHEGYGFDARFRALAEADSGRDSQAYRDHWTALPEHIQRTNLWAALHLPQRLHELGFDWRGRDKGKIPILPENTEIGAKLKAEVGCGGPIDQSLRATAAAEHARWIIDRALNGWRYDDKRSNRRRRHPDMIEFDSLDETTQRLDLTAIRVAFEIGMSDFPERPPTANPIVIEDMDVEALREFRRDATCLRIHFGRSQTRLNPAVQKSLTDLMETLRIHPALCRLHILIHGEDEIQIGRLDADSDELLNDETQPFLRWMSKLCEALPNGVILDMDYVLENHDDRP